MFSNTRRQSSIQTYSEGPHKCYCDDQKGMNATFAFFITRRKCYFFAYHGRLFGRISTKSDSAVTLGDKIWVDCMY